MEESTTYQAIIRKGVQQGKVQEDRELLLLLGEDQFGPAPLSARQRIEALNDQPHLRRLIRQR